MQTFSKYFILGLLGLSVFCVSASGASMKKMPRSQAVSTCVNKAQTQIAATTDEAASKGRVAVYSSCMRDAGYNP
jgi:hypothetical protein